VHARGNDSPERDARDFKFAAPEKATLYVESRVTDGGL
jgi:hypothetical protein